ncbi:MAG: hypothetical protein GVY04_10270 [Cyanobacteria bacterium]|nr:hypothetical protein [Cyanobacteria bacterium GSL.Bin1]
MLAIDNHQTLSSANHVGRSGARRLRAFKLCDRALSPLSKNSDRASLPSTQTVIALPSPS